MHSNISSTSPHLNFTYFCSNVVLADKDHCTFFSAISFVTTVLLRKKILEKSCYVSYICFIFISLNWFAANINLNYLFLLICPGLFPNNKSPSLGLSSLFLTWKESKVVFSLASECNTFRPSNAIATTAKAKQRATSPEKICFNRQWSC